MYARIAIRNTHHGWAIPSRKSPKPGEYLNGESWMKALILRSFRVYLRYGEPNTERGSVRILNCNELTPAQLQDSATDSVSVTLIPSWPPSPISRPRTLTRWPTELWSDVSTNLSW
jgi:hypothetical protein